MSAFHATGSVIFCICSTYNVLFASASFNARLLVSPWSVYEKLYVSNATEHSCILSASINYDYVLYIKSAFTGCIE